MDHDTLNTASTYLNNLLLARGLLRDSKPLDFAKPTRDTRAQVINLVHDLLLRRDRDQESREQIAFTLHKLRADQARKDADVEKLQLRLEEKDRALLQAQTEARNAKIDMRRLESSTKALQDQLGRLKASVAQIKTQCANDIRKRDMHLERLKSHLQGQQRGNKGGLVAPSISTSGRGPHSLNASVRDIHDPEYNLKQETTEFLTQLSAGLSDENDALIDMIRHTMATLKELLGVPDRSDDETMDDIENEDGTVGFAHGSLAEELESMIQMLRTVLTNPNFVSMDEVEARDDEIARLREGWDKMEARWKDLLFMMNGWCTRLEKSGDTINLDELRKGLGLGVGLEAPPTAQKLRAQAENNPGSDAQLLSPSPSNSQPAPSTTKSQRSIDPPDFFNLRPLKQRNQNRVSPSIRSPRKVAFVDHPSENTDPDINLNNFDTPTIVRTSANKPSSPEPNSQSATHRPQSVNDDYIQPSQARSPSPPQLPVDSPSEHVMPNEVDEDEQPRMSVEEKLRVAQAEAEAAAVLASEAKVGGPEDDSQIDFELQEDIIKLRSSPAKKTRIQGRPKRRKSTLSPEELTDLLGLE